MCKCFGHDLMCRYADKILQYIDQAKCIQCCANVVEFEYFLIFGIVGILLGS